MNTLPETNIFAPENGWLEDKPFLLGFGNFSGAPLFVKLRRAVLQVSWEKKWRAVFPWVFSKSAKHSEGGGCTPKICRIKGG